MDLFDRGAPPAPPESSLTPERRRAPLAERLRPESLDEILGQGELLEAGRPLRRAIEGDRIASMILWGPPGSGKTTLARVVAARTRARFVAYSAVLSGIREIKDVMAAAERSAAAGERRTLLFVDEIHRFNRAQQDAFLPHVERGTIVLVGATTENPSFSITAALLSRCAVHVVQPLAEDDLVRLLHRALVHPHGLADRRLCLMEDDLRLIAARAAGDARRALNTLETLALAVGGAPEGEAAEPHVITRSDVERALSRAALPYDRAGEEHYNLISALHKSLRNGDADAALYWLVRMLESGEDPLYVTRRLIRFASEDIGNADPGALRLALLAHEAVQAIGMPEGALALAQAAVYLAGAPKSDSLYRAYGRVVDDLRAGLVDPVPLAVRNAPTALMRDRGYGRGYQSAHDTPEGTAPLEALPGRLRGRRYYEAKPVGAEAALAERLERLRQARARQRDEAGPAAPGDGPVVDVGGPAIRNRKPPPRSRA